MLTEADLAPTGAGPERPPVLWSLALSALFATGYSWMSLLRHRLVETAGYDLGIFTQAVRAYADLRAPVTPLKGPGFNLLGDHFHPVVALWAPAYRLLPHVETVLVAQAAVVAASVFPIHRLAVERLGRVPGAAVATAYGLSWALQGLIAFDVHEVAFAVPLLAFGCVALVRERWPAACGWTLPLLLVKEDLAATVVAVGLYLLLRRRRREGVALCAAGAAAGLVVMTVVIPAVNPRGVYRYWATLSDGIGAADHGRVAGLLRLPMEIVAPPEKLGTLLLLLAVTGFLAVRSPLLLVAAPTLAWRFLSDNPLFWGSGLVHYNAVLMPVLFVAMVDVAARSRSHPRPLVRTWARRAVPVSAGLALALLPVSSFWTVVRADTPVAERRAAAAHAVLARIPDGVLVSASNHLVPQLVDRCTVVLFPDVHVGPARMPEYVVVDTARLGGVPQPEPIQRAALADLRSGRTGYELVAERNEFQLFRRRTAAPP